MGERWIPGQDRRAVRHRGPAGSAVLTAPRHVVVVGGGIAGLSAAAGLAERGVAVTVVERCAQLGGRVRAWPVDGGAVADPPRTMSRGFHAFFRQYYNLRALLRRFDPALESLTPIEDYPLISADGHRDSFTEIPRTPPANIASFVARSPSFTAAGLARVDVGAALELLDVDFPETFSRYDGESAAAFLDRLNFPDRARHLALEVFARSFFADPRDFSAGELVAMFHTYFLGSSEGLLFDVPTDDYDTALWAPLGRHLATLGVEVLTEHSANALQLGDSGPVHVEMATGSPLKADAVVLATDIASTRELVARAPELGDHRWRSRVGETTEAPPFAVWRIWLDRLVKAERSSFLGTSGFGPLDNVSLLERFETGAARWSDHYGGSVVELHAYALPNRSPDEVDGEAVKARLRIELSRVYPETAAARIVADEWLVADDCPLAGTGPWRRRLEVSTPDPRVVLAGDGIRCDFPVALMERAATTGFLAANELLGFWGVTGHDVWSAPMRSRHRLVRLWQDRRAS